MANPLQTLARRLLSVSRFVGWQEGRQLIQRLRGYSVQAEFRGAPQNVLVLAPHPDDEIFGCGGSLALRAKRGDTITVAYLSNGERGTIKGVQDSKLAETRYKEAVAGLIALGIDKAKTHWASLPDGNITNAKAKKVIETLLHETAPDIIYAPWFGDEHPDHVATAEGLIDALGTHAPEMWMYEVWSPLPATTIVPIGSIEAIKEKAIACHKSQLVSRSYAQAIRGLTTYRGFQAGLEEKAEAYLVLSASSLKKHKRKAA